MSNQNLTIPANAVKNDFVGCYNDASQKLFSDYLGDYSFDKCNQEALKKNYKYFALQNIAGLSNDKKAKCYAGNTEPGTAPHTSTTCPTNTSDDIGNTWGESNISAIYKVTNVTTLPNDLLLNASSSDNWSFGTIEGNNMQIKNSDATNITAQVFYTRNMKGDGSVLTNYDHGDMKNGGNIKTYNISGNSTIDVQCTNNNMGSDPFPGYQKVCYKKIKQTTLVGRYIKIQAGIKPCCMNWGNISVYSEKGGNNIAKKSRVYMSSSYSPKNEYPGSNLVDENEDTFAHTNCNDTNYSWMLVDLGNDVPIHKIIMTSRKDCCRDRGVGSTVSIYDSSKTHVYTSNPFSSSDDTKITTDKGSSSTSSYKYYIMFPPFKNVLGTNNLTSEYMIETFDGANIKKESDNTYIYVILVLFLLICFFVYFNNRRN